MHLKPKIAVLGLKKKCSLRAKIIQSFRAKKIFFSKCLSCVELNSKNIS
jgi:hypothetical protein